MARHVRLAELLLGVEGLALLRHLYDGSDVNADRRLEEMRWLLGQETFADGEPIRELAPRAGYEAWSESYDEPGNPIIAIEQSAVWSVLDRLSPGRALDAACGTGRHAGQLVSLGHDVVGFDLTPEMLTRARANVAGARFLEADLLAIPAADGELDLVVCGLALSHLADLDGGVAELARVLGPGGHLVISVLHPFWAQLGWHAPFIDRSGARAFVREHAHSHASYLAAFRAGRLEVLDCLEPAITAEQVSAKRRAFRHIPEATMQAYAGLPGVLVWHLGKS